MSHQEPHKACEGTGIVFTPGEGQGVVDCEPCDGTGQITMPNPPADTQLPPQKSLWQYQRNTDGVSGSVFMPSEAKVE